jgi:hypothetical protein
MTYREQHEFRQSPPELWRAMEEMDQFELWWSWLEEFRLEGDSLAAGSVLHGVIAPPLPYRMRIRVELTQCDPYRHIDALVHGDLEGEARLDMRDAGAGSIVDMAWTVEMMQRPMRMASRFAQPLMQWGHDVVVGITVAGFRRRLESTDN